MPGADGSATPGLAGHDAGRRHAVNPTRAVRLVHGRRDSRPRAGTTRQPDRLGPLKLTNPTIGLADTKFKDGKLVLTIGIDVDEATLGFGGGMAGARRRARS